MNTKSDHGGCLCGAVQYTIKSPPITAVHCHCSDCRRATGAAFSTVAVYPRNAIVWEGETPRRVAWADRLRLSCPKCGTPLGILPDEQAAIVVLNAGSHDEPGTLAPACHVWTEERLPWISLGDGLPVHARGLGG